MPIRTEVRGSRIDTEDRGEKVYRCEIVVLEEDEVLSRRHYARKLDNFSIDQDQLQGYIDEQKSKILREAQNMKRIDPESIS